MVTHSSINFTDEILSMMHCFGDSSQPLAESAQLIQSIVHEQLIALVNKAKSVAQVRQATVISAEDIFFLLRKDRSKLARLMNHLCVKDIKASISGPIPYKDTMSLGRRVKVCSDFLKQLDEFGEYKKIVDQAVSDEAKIQRLRRIETMTRNMSQAEYNRFAQARRMSFMKVSTEQFSEWLLTGTNVDINRFAFEIIQYLANETVAQIVDLALLVKQDCNRTINDPSSILITDSIHNKYVKVSSPITPANIYEAMRRFCAPVGCYKRNQDSLVILAI